MSRSTRVPFACASSPGDDTSGGGEHVAPLGEGFVRRDEDRHGEVPAGDDLEEEVGIAVVVVEVPDLVDGQKLRAGEATQSPGEGGVGVLSGEFVKHVGGGGESGGEAVEDGVVEEVLHEHGLPDAVRSRRILPTIKAARRQSTTRSIRVAVSAWRLCVASDLAT